MRKYFYHLLQVLVVSLLSP
uniref:Uncharacterized protein n=1 Tax=Arundo donax TaxID=35708 RepID=A0A0A9GUR4_ARUDO